MALGAVFGGFHAVETSIEVNQMMFNIGVVQVIPFVMIYVGFIADSWEIRSKPPPGS